MARPAIFLTLIAATLIGPCLCCCTLARAFAHPVSTAQATQTSPKPAACPHCRPPADVPKADRPTPTSPVPPTQPCPYCDGGVQLTTAAPPTISPFVVDVPFVALLPVDSAAAAVGSPEFRAEYPPGWGTQAFLLDSCHRLRC